MVDTCGMVDGFTQTDCLEVLQILRQMSLPICVENKKMLVNTYGGMAKSGQPVTGLDLCGL